MPDGINERRQHARAKLTLHLHVTGVRNDGYHLLDAEMTSLDFADVLEFSDGDGLEVTGPAASGVPASSANLVARALALTGRTAHVRLNKVIPAGAGLGGGSSDAAAALRWTGVTDHVVAARIGADVPFCITGGRARVRGIGDVLEPLPFEERTFTLLIPPFGVNTAAVYRAFDAGHSQADDGRNHLEAAALVVEPRLAAWRDRLGEATGQTPVLAGSGATWFVEGEWQSPDLGGMDGATWVVARATPPLTAI